MNGSDTRLEGSLRALVREEAAAATSACLTAAKNELTDAIREIARDGFERSTRAVDTYIRAMCPSPGLARGSTATTMVPLDERAGDWLIQARLACVAHATERAIGDASLNTILADAALIAAFVINGVVDAQSEESA